MNPTVPPFGAPVTGMRASTQAYGPFSPSRKASEVDASGTYTPVKRSELDRATKDRPGSRWDSGPFQNTTPDTTPQQTPNASMANTQTPRQRSISPRRPIESLTPLTSGQLDKPQVMSPKACSVPPSRTPSTPKSKSLLANAPEPQGTPKRHATVHDPSPAPLTPARVRERRPRHHVQKRTSIGPWSFYRSIGAGSMGQVKLAMNYHTKELAAVKIVPKAFTQKESDPRESNAAKDTRIIREAAIGKLVYHPNISRLIEVYSMTSHYYLVFEYVAGGQLLDYIIAHGSVKETQSRAFARSIASALDYCHRNSIVHRDLKIENILVDETGHIKIIDFGLSNMFRRDALLKTFCGSLYFAAPELLSAQPYRGPEIDIWSFGVVLYVLVCGKVPFEDKSMSALHAKIKRGVVEYPAWLSPPLVDLLSRMLLVSPTDRATLKEIINHPWLNLGFESPVESLVPRRVPVEFPLDSLVLKEMATLGLGTEHELTAGLEAVLYSQEYQHAVSAWHDFHSHPSSSSSGFGVDPLDAYHPLVSMYLLVVEHLERRASDTRNKLADANPDGDANPASNEITSPAGPHALAPGTLRPQRRIATSPFGTPQHTMRMVDPAAVSRSDMRLGAPVKQPPPPAAMQHLGVDTFTQLDRPRTPEKPLPEMVRTRARSKTYGALQGPPAPLTQAARTSNDSAGSVTPQSPDKPRISSLFRRISLRRRRDDPAEEVPRATAMHSRAKSMGYRDLSSVRNRLESERMPSIEAPKQVFFRGFFSVQTTSSLTPLEIRAEILRVLKGMLIDYVEIRGGFSCIYGASVATTGGETPSSPVRERTHVRNRSFGTPISSPRNDGQVLSDTNSSSNESVELGGSDMLGHVPSKVPSPVRFEISIVRVPLLSLHGVQFKKLSGNVWQYKTVAQEILGQLKL